eukprot:6376407-Prymnesium_polylepis.1
MVLRALHKPRERRAPALVDLPFAPSFGQDEELLERQSVHPSVAVHFGHERITCKLHRLPARAQRQLDPERPFPLAPRPDTQGISQALEAVALNLPGGHAVEEALAEEERLGAEPHEVGGGADERARIDQKLAEPRVERGGRMGDHIEERLPCVRQVTRHQSRVAEQVEQAPVLAECPALHLVAVNAYCALAGLALLGGELH